MAVIEEHGDLVTCLALVRTQLARECLSKLAQLAWLLVLFLSSRHSTWSLRFDLSLMMGSHTSGIGCAATGVMGSIVFGICCVKGIMCKIGWDESVRVEDEYRMRREQEIRYT